MSGPAPIAILLPTLRFGGAERVAINLAKGMINCGQDVEIVIAAGRRRDTNILRPPTPMVELPAGRVLTAVPALVRYLRRRRPRAVISHMTHMNLAAIVANRLAATGGRTILVEHNLLANFASLSRKTSAISLLARILYRGSAQIVGVSNTVTASVESGLGLKTGSVVTINNAVVDRAQVDASRGIVHDHPWFVQKDCPLLVAAGRMSANKGFATLLHAFALLRKKRRARLLILGDGEERATLATLITKLGISNDVLLRGYVDDPMSYMTKCDLLVHPAVANEGLPTVVIEALACDCKVVATNVAGATEILDQGKYGALIPTGDPEQMCDAIETEIDYVREPDSLRRRASSFSIENASRAYLRLIDTPDGD